jgi:hypothetical protein
MRFRIRSWDGYARVLCRLKSDRLRQRCGESRRKSYERDQSQRFESLDSGLEDEVEGGRAVSAPAGTRTMGADLAPTFLFSGLRRSRGQPCHSLAEIHLFLKSSSREHLRYESLDMITIFTVQSQA